MLLGSLPLAHDLNGENVKNFPLKDVKLLDSPFKRADDLNVEVLLKYDVDRLLAPILRRPDLRRKPSHIQIGMVLTGMSAGIILVP